MPTLSAAPTPLSDEAAMGLALAQAQAAQNAGEVPVGAVLVRNGELLAEGYNQPITTHDPTAHAEIVALRTAAAAVGNYRLPDTTLYVTLEPCPMCAASISAARVGRLYYGAADPKSGGVAVGARVFTHPQCHHVPEVYDGIGALEAEALLKAFFAERR